MAAAGEVAPANPAVPDLRRVLAELRRAPHRLRIGLDREVRCVALLDHLSAAGVQLTTAAEAASWLAPLLSTNADDERAVRAVLDDYHAAVVPETTAPEALERATAKAVPALAPVSPWPLAITMAAVAVIGGLSLVLGGGTAADVPPFSTTPGATGPSLPGIMPIALGVITTLLGFLLIFLTRHRRSTAMLRPATLRTRVVTADAGHLDLFAPGPLRPVLRALREHVLPHGHWADVPASIAATVRAGGLPAIVFGGRPRLPDYLLLVEVRGADDQAAMLGRLLLRRLQAAQVHLDAFAFAVDPTVLRPLDRPHVGTGHSASATQSLIGVTSRSAGRRLLLVTDGRLLLDPLSGRLLEHLAPLRRFEPRVVLTPVPRDDWGERERNLAAEGFAILPLSPEGLGDLARWLTAPEEHPAPALPDTLGGPDLAAQLDADPAWLQPDPPPAPVLRRTVAALRRYLGPAGFRLLAAGAVSPLPGAGLTLRLARRFSAEGHSIDETALARLTRLPWLRRAPMPFWLRTALCRELSPSERLAALDTLLLLVAGADETPRVLDRPGRIRLARLARRQADGLMRDDPVLAGVLADAGVGQGPEARDVALTAGAMALGIGATYGADAVIGLLGRIAGLLASGSSVVGGVAAFLSLAWIFGTIFWTYATHRGLLLLAKVVHLRHQEEGGIIMAALAVLTAVASGSLLTPQWQGALVSASLAMVLIALSPLVAVLGMARRPWLQAWTAAWAPPWAALFALAFGGVSFLTMLTMTEPGATLVGWLGMQVPLAAATLVAGLVASAGLARNVPRADTAALTLLFAGGGALAWIACWSALRLLGHEYPSGDPASTFQPLFWLSLDLHMFGGAAFALLVSGVAAGRAVWVMAGVCAAVAAVTVVGSLNPTLYVLLLALPPLRTGLVAWVAGLTRWELLRACGLAFAIRSAALIGVGLAVTTKLRLPGLDEMLSAMPGAVLVEWVALHPVLRWAVVRPRVNWTAWRDALVLLPCALTVSLGGLLGWPNVPFLVVPLAAWLAQRHGLAALGPAGVMMAPMLVSVHSPGTSLDGAWGLWVAALLMMRLVADPWFQAAVTRVSVITRLEAWLLVGAVSLVVTTDFFARNFPILMVPLSVSLAGLLPFLLTLVGLSRAAWQPVVWPLACMTAVGVMLALLGIRIPIIRIAAPTTATFFGGILVIMLASSWRVSPTAPGVLGRLHQLLHAPQPRYILQGLLLLAWFDSFLLVIRVGDGADLSLFALSHLLAIAFWAGYARVLFWPLLVVMTGWSVTPSLSGLNFQVFGGSVGLQGTNVPEAAATLLQVWAFQRFGTLVKTSGWVPGQAASRDGASGIPAIGRVIGTDLLRAVSLVLWAGVAVLAVFLAYILIVPASHSVGSAPDAGYTQEPQQQQPAKGADPSGARAN